MMVSKDGDVWTVLAEDVDVSDMHHNKYKDSLLCAQGCFLAEKEMPGSVNSVTGMPFRKRKT